MIRNRIFNPTKYATVDDEVHLVHQCHTVVQRIAGHEQAIVIEIKGLHSDLAHCPPYVAFGIYLGPVSDHNEGETVSADPQDVPLNSEAAEIYAAVMAVGIAHKWIQKEPQFHEGCEMVVVKTDSSALVRYITDYVWIWQEEGYVTEWGEPVLFPYGLETLHR